MYMYMHVLLEDIQNVHVFTCAIIGMVLCKFKSGVFGIRIGIFPEHRLTSA